MSCQQIALGPLGKQLQRLVGCVELQSPTTDTQPRDQPIRVHRPHLDPGALRFDGAHPISALSVPVEPRRENEKYGVAVVHLEEIDQRRASGSPRFPARHANFHDASRSEQREVARRCAHVIPIRASLHEMHVALRESQGASTGANGIRRFTRQQGLVAGNEVRRRKVLLQVSRQGIGGQLHV